ncbi:hypothetical protein CRENBAI_021259 [Crenichthys baileyi]|uniref:Uncharacterized protein n=1 Tax=Crenichthys baileyi TaxID=28760 RepID=A0AAV9RXD5_9TELE
MAQKLPTPALSINRLLRPAAPRPFVKANPDCQSQQLATSFSHTLQSSSRGIQWCCFQVSKTLTSRVMSKGHQRSNHVNMHLQPLSQPHNSIHHLPMRLFLTLRSQEYGQSPSSNECSPGAATRRVPAGSATLTGHANHLPGKEPKQLWSLVTYCRNHIETGQDSGGHYGSWGEATMTRMGSFSSSQSALSNGTTHVQNNLSYTKLEAQTYSIKMVP